MSSLHYQIWQHGQPFSGFAVSPYGGRLVKTGTIAVSTSMSAPIDVPEAAGQIDTVVLCKVFGGKPIYIELAKPDDPDPSGTSAHVAEDTRLRVLVHPTYGSQSITVPHGWRFAAVEAADFA